MLPATINQRVVFRKTEKALPVISLFMPFNPKVTPRHILANQLDLTVMEVKNELDRHYPVEETYTLMARLGKLVSELNYGTYKKSIAVYLSVNTEKVFYLDMDIRRHVVADGALSMRHIIESKVDNHNCLLLLLSSERVKIFHLGADGLRRLLSVSPHNMGSRQDNQPERVGNFSDPSAFKEIMLDKFMHYADHSLSMMLTCYSFPVIVMATEKTGGHFKKITNNNTHIATYIHGNFDDASESNLLQAIAPYMQQWDDLKQHHLLEQLEKAMSSGKVASGIRNVNREALMHKGRFLLIEKNYRYKPDIAAAREKNSRPFYLQDKVDEAILNVIESGGDVEFVDDGALAEYGQVALIKYY